MTVITSRTFYLFSPIPSPSPSTLPQSNPSNNPPVYLAEFPNPLPASLKPSTPSSPARPTPFNTSTTSQERRILSPVGLPSQSGARSSIVLPALSCLLVATPADRSRTKISPRVRPSCPSRRIAAGRRTPARVTLLSMRSHWLRFPLRVHEVGRRSMSRKCFLSGGVVLYV